MNLINFNQMTAQEAKNKALWLQIPDPLRRKIDFAVNSGMLTYTAYFTTWAKEGIHHLLFDETNSLFDNMIPIRHTVKSQVINALEKLGYTVIMDWDTNIHERLKERECYLTINWG